MAKKNKQSMARKYVAKAQSGDEQMDLIDVGPENLQKIVPHARRYRQAVRERMRWGRAETDEKEHIRRLVRDAELSRLPDGSIRFRCDGLLISLTPRDELIKVKDEKEGDE